MGTVGEMRNDFVRVRDELAKISADVESRKAKADEAVKLVQELSNGIRGLISVNQNIMKDLYGGLFHTDVIKKYIVRLVSLYPNFIDFVKEPEKTVLGDLTDDELDYLDELDVFMGYLFNDVLGDSYKGVYLGEDGFFEILNKFDHELTKSIEFIDRRVGVGCD